MEDVIVYPQQFFSIPNFRKAVEDWPHWRFHHNETTGTYTTEDKYRRGELFYRTLGDDLLALYQKFCFFTGHRTPILPKEDNRLYLFLYIPRQNLPFTLSQNGTTSEIRHSAIVFCNNYASPVFEYPKGHRGEDVQLLISEHFLREYINPAVSANSSLHNIIHGTDRTCYVMPQAPGAIRRQMNRLVKEILMRPSFPMNKLHVLQKTSTVLDLFFRMHSASPVQAGGYSGNARYRALSSPLAAEQKKGPSASPRLQKICQVARYLEVMLHVPFPGLEFLASKFDLSVSGLKRSFKKMYHTTPLRYYRKQQMHYAVQQLQNSHRPVTDIAAELGFNSSGNFIRVFKAEIGTTPGHFRQQ